jgi:hypothetical protein
VQGLVVMNTTTREVGLDWQRTFADVDLSEFEPELGRMLVVARTRL